VTQILVIIAFEIKKVYGEKQEHLLRLQLQI